MKNLKLSLFLLTWALAAQANALLIEVTPSNQTAFVGDNAVFDVVATGLGTDLIGSYDATLSWDSTLLSLIGVTFDSFLDGPMDAIQGSPTGVGIVNVFEVSLSTLNLQNGDNFRMFSLTFNTLSEGVSFLGFDSLIVGDAFGIALDPASTSGSIEISAQPTNSVPEPTGLALFIAGIIALRLVRKPSYQGDS